MQVPIDSSDKRCVEGRSRRTSQLGSPWYQNLYHNLTDFQGLKEECRNQQLICPQVTSRFRYAQVSSTEAGSLSNPSLIGMLSSVDKINCSDSIGWGRWGDRRIAPMSWGGIVRLLSVRSSILLYIDEVSPNASLSAKWTVSTTGLHLKRRNLRRM